MVIAPSLATVGLLALKLWIPAGVSLVAAATGPTVTSMIDRFGFKRSTIVLTSLMPINITAMCFLIGGGLTSPFVPVLFTFPAWQVTSAGLRSARRAIAIAFLGILALLVLQLIGAKSPVQVGPTATAVYRVFLISGSAIALVVGAWIVDVSGAELSAAARAELGRTEASRQDDLIEQEALREALEGARASLLRLRQGNYDCDNEPWHGTAHGVGSAASAEIESLGEVIRAIHSSVRECMSSVESGDLRIRWEGQLSGDLGSLQAVFNEALETLDSAIHELATSAGDAANATQMLATTAAEQATAARHSREQIALVSKEVAEIASNSKLDANNAAKAMGLAQESNELVQRGRDSLDNLGDALASIRAGAAEARDIVSSINKIAFQTNLLALNAAIEASRAGDEGLGFGVIADEVRRLAGRSSESASETSRALHASQQIAELAVIDQESLAECFSGIADSMHDTRESIANVAAKIQEQAATLAEASSYLLELGTLADQDLARTEENAGLVTDLELTTHALLEDTNGFRTSGRRRE